MLFDVLTDNVYYIVFMRSW